MTAWLRRSSVAAAIVLSACAAANPGSADNPTATGAAYGSFLAARYADASSDPASAAHYYGLAVRADPGNQALINEDFIAAILSGSPQAGDLASQVDGNALAVMLLGNQDAAAGHYAAAQARFAQLPNDSLSAILRPLLLAWCAAGQGRPADAIATLVPLAGAGNFGGIDLLTAALIADQSNDLKNAAALYSAADPGDQQPNLRLAQILASWKARQGQPEAARAELEAMAASHPSLALALPNLEAVMAAPVIATPADGLAETYLTIAGALDQPQQSLLRVTFLRFALALRPNLAAARLLLADIQVGADQPAPPAGEPAPVITDTQLHQAIDTLAQIPPADPLYTPAALQRANLLAALNQPDDAIALLKQIAARNPGSLDPIQQQGDILRGAGSFAPAVAAYTQAINALPNPPPAAAWQLYYDRGIALDQQGLWSAAEPDMQTALALSPNQPYVLNYLGYTWALHGEHLPKARAMLQQALTLDPNEGAIIDSLGFISLRQGETAQALKLLTQAVELDPDDAEVNAHLGDAFYASGQKLQADYQWQRALALKPDRKLQAEIEDKLKQVAGPPA